MAQALLSALAVGEAKVSMSGKIAGLMPPPGMISGTKTVRPVFALMASARSLLLERWWPKASVKRMIVEEGFVGIAVSAEAWGDAM